MIATKLGEYLKSFWWFLIWVAITISICLSLGLDHADIPLRTRVIEAVSATAICVLVGSALLAGITLVCSSRRWLRAIAIVCSATLGIFAVYSSLKVPRFQPERWRVGAIARDGWVSDSTGRGTASHHGGVKEWLYYSWQRPLTDPEVGAWRFGHVWIPAYFAITFLLAWVGTAQVRLEKSKDSSVSGQANSTDDSAPSFPPRSNSLEGRMRNPQTSAPPSEAPQRTASKKAGTCTSVGNAVERWSAEEENRRTYAQNYEGRRDI
ncbi:MAG: hypothetical protein C5B50_14265 [Verrucomicrobia bacterium]|nr:MAG: hypothetical protein C5B50_14265 [Verrucomicrobiota bacterium]